MDPESGVAWADTPDFFDDFVTNAGRPSAMTQQPERGTAGYRGVWNRSRGDRVARQDLLDEARKLPLGERARAALSS